MCFKLVSSIELEAGRQGEMGRGAQCAMAQWCRGLFLVDGNRDPGFNPSEGTR